jgi:hypothetical protein
MSCSTDALTALLIDQLAPRPWWSPSSDVILGGLLAAAAGFLGVYFTNILQTKRDHHQRLESIASLRKALRSEITNLWETYKEDAGNEVEKKDQMTNPYYPARGYVPSLRHTPILTGVSSNVGLLNPQELGWINRTYATLSKLQQTFEIVEERRKEQELKPLGQNIRGYTESLAKRERYARENIHALHDASKRWVMITQRLLDRPLDAKGNPVGPGPFDEEQKTDRT